jgi:hypothetical protein
MHTSSIKSTFVFLCFVLVLCPPPALSQIDQGIESLMTRRVPDCFEIALNSFRLIPSFYQRGERDSALLILNYWHQRCEREIINRTRVVFALEVGSFSEDSLDPGFVYSLAKPKDMEPDQGWHSPIEQEYLAALTSYETFLASVSLKAISRTKPGTVEYLLSRHFSGRSDSTLSDLQSPDYADTKLHRDYINAVESIKNNHSETYLGIGIGSWIPVSKELRVFGPRPEVSVTLFSGHLGYNSQLSFALRFGPSRDAYTFTYKGVSYSTTQFLGFSMGYEVLPRIAISKHNDLSLLAGLMIDGYSPPKSDGNVDDKGANSFNATIGLKYGYKPSPWGTPLIVLEMRMNPFLFGTSGFDDAPLGTSATLRLSVFFGKDERAEALDRLSYRE